ncbi:MAG: MoaD/ThiS family protein [Nitrosopumilus sp.]|nr:MoaD/ThiS family protein [Nitrosopumilus sp.]CAI9832093.1 putative ThiamineS protein [Nitrosopumilaceae archaeon]MDA7941408.1 MoaD/ThiS family protein [Nitrosopumilus sp.]MDA7942816.1 MoaD/ThiS family protein [Nitrosopumilus sp.]MDA7945102.1 MoaD/ThiS family protein [Nitrosopumilus sp.]
MITVRALGGAKKSLGGGDLRMRHGITISELLRDLERMVPEGSPPLDTSSVIVAVNGADSSALGGRGAVLADGDVVQIVPVVHGGSGAHEYLRVAGRRVLVASAAGPDIDALRRSHRGLAIQAVSDRYVLGRYHLGRIIGLSIHCKRRGLMLASRLETDLLMRLALTSQISEAISEAGARPGMPCVVISMGASRGLGRLLRSLEPAGPLYSRDNGRFLARRAGITRRQVSACRSRRPLDDLLAERAALL